MSEEYEEVYDFKKIIIVGGIIALVVILSALVFISINTDWFESFENWLEFPNPILDFPEFIPKIELPTMNQDEDIKPNYRKFLDFGISADDIKDIQNMECITFENEALISKDPKYTMIFEERRSEC